MASLPRLITIPLSHFCEKARWALDRTGIEYREEPHLPLVHRLHTAGVGCQSVPILVIGSRVIPDSGSILKWIATQNSDLPLYPPKRDCAPGLSRSSATPTASSARMCGAGHIATCSAPRS